MSDTKERWRAFERLVAQIQRQLAPAATVTESESIVGVSGVTRRVDVTIRQSISAYPILVVIDCKHHRRKVDLSYVAAFADQARDVRASRAVLISNTGFTKGASAIADAHNVVLQTLREAETTDWVAQVGPGAWTSIVSVSAEDVQSIVVSPAGTVFEATLDTPALDREGNQAETVGKLFWDWWKGLGRERKVGATVFRAHAAPARVFVKVTDQLEEVERFEVSCELIARRWFVPLKMDHGHVLLNATGEPEYHEFTTSSFQWRQIMETLPGEPIDPSEFERITRQSRTYADLDGAERFLRLVLQSKARGER